MQVTVIVPSYGRAAVLRRCLLGIAMQEVPPSELLVVVRSDDHETLHTVEAHRVALPFIRAVLATERGLVAALNAGLASARGDIIVYIDDDAVPRSDWLRRIVAAYESDRSIAAVGGKDVVHVGDMIDDSQSALFLKRLRSSGAPTVGRVKWFGRVIGNHNAGAGCARDVDFLKGVNMSYRRDDLTPHGFDTRLLGHGVQMHTEASASMPLKRAGKRVVYDPNIIVDHYPAVRPHGDHRGEQTEARIFQEAHNQLLPIIDSVPVLQRWLISSYGFLVGSASYPGLVNAVRLQLAGTRHAGSHFRAAAGGRRAAIKTTARSRQKHSTSTDGMPGGRAVFRVLWESGHSAAHCRRLGARGRDQARIVAFCLAAALLRRSSGQRMRSVFFTARFDATDYRLEAADVSELHALYDVLIRDEYRVTVSHEPHVIVDAGANIGAAALFFRSVYPKAVVIAAEPNPETYARLVRNVAHDPWIHPIQAALVARSGTLRLVSTEMTWTSHVVAESANVPVLGKARSVTGLDLPDLLRRAGRPGATIDLLKLDIEGSEHALFTGDMRDCSAIRHLVVEVHDDGSKRSYADLLQPFLRTGDAVSWLADHVAHVELKGGRSMRDDDQDA